jgi:hypothetical protein
MRIIFFFIFVYHILALKTKKLNSKLNNLYSPLYKTTDLIKFTKDVDTHQGMSSS